MSLVHTLPAGPLDVIGDVHGERHALTQLVRHLGYDDNGHHRQGIDDQIAVQFPPRLYFSELFLFFEIISRHYASSQSINEFMISSAT